MCGSMHERYNRRQGLEKYCRFCEDFIEERMIYSCKRQAHRGKRGIGYQSRVRGADSNDLNLIYGEK